MPGRIRLSFGGATIVPPIDDEHVRRRRLGQIAVAEHHRLDGARVGGQLAHQHVADERDRLEVAALPAVVLGGDDGHPALDLLGRSASRADCSS